MQQIKAHTFRVHHDYLQLERNLNSCNVEDLTLEYL